MSEPGSEHKKFLQEEKKKDKQLAKERKKNKEKKRVICPVIMQYELPDGFLDYIRHISIRGTSTTNVSQYRVCMFVLRVQRKI